MNSAQNLFDPHRAATAVPERRRITRPQEFGICKRCLCSDTNAGDIIVAHYGRGWRHDACYRAVNPAFYRGLREPPQSEQTMPETSPNDIPEDIPF